MNREIKFELNQTYATKENARKAVAKKNFQGFRHFIYQNEEGRYLPVFVGEAAVQAGIHFHFSIVG